VWIVVGLGNPGREYEDTRHNLGYLVADELLRRGGARAKRGGDFVAAEVTLAGEQALVVKPTTYVNRTGRALAQMAARRPLELPFLLAVVDDVALPFGRLRLRPIGSAGGHNGLRSMIEVLGSEAFPRLRLGVGAAPPGMPLEDWVLSPFSKEEARELPDLVARGADAVERVLELGVERAVPVVNAPGGGGGGEG
jgi:PTH1 family peptidyl-tRNA hydrolase